jgi:hypothetical protein
VKRNCGIALFAWIALVIGYGVYLRDEFRFPAIVVAPLVFGSITWMALLMIKSSRDAWRDWRARNRMRGGEPPADGELVAAVGRLHVLGHPLIAPFSGEECAMYSYEVGRPRTGSSNSARDYVGFGFARCVVRAPHRDMVLGTIPVIEQFSPEDVEATETGAAYVRTTEFEIIDRITEVAKKMFGIYRERAPLRRDWQLGEAPADLGELEIKERLVREGDAVTAIGRFESSTQSLISGESEYLRLNLGGDARKPELLPFAAIGRFVGGVALGAAANGVLWAMLELMPR